MVGILQAIEQALAANHVVYLHCWGGIGRTGTVIACYLIQQGLAGSAALDRIALLRQGTPDSHRRSPETDAQCAFVLSWDTATRAGH
jgi:protein-tyrosine phosphatase